MSELPDNWSLLKLGDIAHTTSGGTPKRSMKEYYNGKIPWVKSGDLNDGRLFSCNEYITELGLQKSSAKIFAPGTILIALYGATIGKLSILDFEASTNQAICGITPLNNLDTKYLFYFLRHKKEDLINLGKGGAQPNISQQIVREVDVPLAPLDQQKRIVAKIEELFSHIDAGIASLKQAKKLLAQYRQSILKAAVTGELTKEWREQNKDTLEPASKLLERILVERRQKWEEQQLAKFKSKGKTPKDDKWKEKYKELNFPSAKELRMMPDLPNGWNYTLLGNLIEDPKYGTSQKCSYDTNGTGVLRIPNVSNGHIDASDLKFATFNNQEKATYELEEGDILTIRSNGSINIVGKCALIKNIDTGYLYAGYLIRLRPFKKSSSGKYIMNTMNSSLLRQQIESRAKSTSGVNNINSGELQSLIIPICSLEEQMATNDFINAKLSAMNNLINNIETNLATADKNKQSILSSAFSGTLHTNKEALP